MFYNKEIHTIYLRLTASYGYNSAILLEYFYRVRRVTKLFVNSGVKQGVCYFN